MVADDTWLRQPSPSRRSCCARHRALWHCLTSDDENGVSCAEQCRVVPACSACSAVAVVDEWKASLCCSSSASSRVLLLLRAGGRLMAQRAAPAPVQSVTVSDRAASVSAGCSPCSRCFPHSSFLHSLCFGVIPRVLGHCVTVRCERERLSASERGLTAQWVSTAAQLSSHSRPLSQSLSSQPPAVLDVVAAELSHLIPLSSRYSQRQHRACDQRSFPCGTSTGSAPSCGAALLPSVLPVVGRRCCCAPARPLNDAAPPPVLPMHSTTK